MTFSVSSNDQAINLAPNAYTLVDYRSDQRKYYYRINNSQLALIERISKLVLVLIKTIVTLGLALISSDIRSQWREVIGNKREIITHHLLASHETETTSNQFEILPEPEPLPNLQELHDLLDQGNYKTVTDEELLNLEELNLSDNDFEILPDSIGLLLNLRKLNLSENEFQSLPDSIGLLLNLRKLDLSYNDLRTLPDKISLLSNLRKLNLSTNELQSLPNSIGLLSNLRKLDLSYNDLRALPDSISFLPNLRKLSLKGNQLRTLPNRIGLLPNLRKLDLKGNQLQTIPECLYRLPPSCQIRLTENPLSEQTIEQVRTRTQEADYAGPEFLFDSNFELRSTAVPADTTGLQNLETILTEWCDDTCRQKLVQRLSIEQENDLSNWLQRLEDTNDYQEHNQRIKDKVGHFLTWLAEEPIQANVQLAFLMLASATSTCGDRVAQSFNPLFIHMKVCKSANLPLSELKELIIGCERYEKLYKIAEKNIDKQKYLRLNVDPIEVHLCYEVSLKDRLKLPIETQDMLYRSLSNVTNQEIEQAAQLILNETGPDQQLDLLLNHPLWKHALEKSPLFEEVQQSCQQQKEEALAAVDTTNDKASQQFFSEFQEKDKTIWDPYYVLTQQIVNRD